MTRPLQLDVTGAPEGLADSEPAVGDVYPITGGRGGARYAIVVGISGETAYELKFSPSGEIYGTGQSGLHYLRRRAKIGRLRSMPTLDVEWFQDPLRPICCGCVR